MIDGINIEETESGYGFNDLLWIAKIDRMCIWEEVGLSQYQTLQCVHFCSLLFVGEKSNRMGMFLRK